MPVVSSIHARQILDSRGHPTVEVDCTLDDGSFGRASVPSGVSAGEHEALEMRDGDKTVYLGKSVLKAVKHVNTVIDDMLRGRPVNDHRTVDQLLLDLDGTVNKSKLGANAILGTSMAICRARAVSERKPLWRSLALQYEIDDPVLLPLPMMVIIEGGAHSDAGLAFQELMIVPTGFNCFSDALRAGSEIFHILQDLLHEDGHIIAVGAEGACAPRVETSLQAWEYIVRAIEKARYGGKVKLAMDAAASEFYRDGKYTVDGKAYSSSELTAFYGGLMKRYPIVSIEDSHDEDDWEGFVSMKKEYGSSIQLVGDDFLVTNVRRIQKAIDEDAVNAVLIKVNQIGSVTETVDAIRMTQAQGWAPIVSHRGGDTEDTFIAHLSVGLRTGQIKTGSLSRGERTCKYNELLRIEEELGADARYESPF